MNNDDIELKKEYFEKIAEKFKNTNVKFPDIRNRKWENLDCEAAKLLKHLIAAENIFINFDEYQMNNNQCYPEIEDMMLLSSELTRKYLKFVDNNPEILEVK